MVALRSTARTVRELAPGCKIRPRGRCGQAASSRHLSRSSCLRLVLEGAACNCALIRAANSKYLLCNCWKAFDACGRHVHLRSLTCFPCCRAAYVHSSKGPAAPGAFLADPQALLPTNLSAQGGERGDPFIGGLCGFATFVLGRCTCCSHASPC